MLPEGLKDLEGPRPAGNRRSPGLGRKSTRDPLKSTGRPPDINLHQKSAPETNSNAKWWRTLGFSPEIDPGTPLDRPGTPRTSVAILAQAILAQDRPGSSSSSSSSCQLAQHARFRVPEEANEFRQPLRTAWAIAVPSGLCPIPLAQLRFAGRRLDCDETVARRNAGGSAGLLPVRGGCNS